MKKLLICAGIIIMGLPLFAAKLLMEDGSAINAFYNDGDMTGIHCKVVGVIDSTGTREFSTEKEKELGMKIQGKTKAVIRLSESDSVADGSLLYIVNERNLIVAKVTVSTVFSSVSFNRICVAYGNVRNVQKDFHAVIPASDSLETKVYEYIARGNFYREKENLSEAIEEYEKAVAIDKKSPEAHSALGYIYLERGMIQFAQKEFTCAYDNAGRVYDKEEKFLLLKGCAKSRYLSIFNSELPRGNQLRDKYVSEGIQFGKEALDLYPDSAEVNFMTGAFYYDLSSYSTKIDTANELKARDYMLKVLKLQDNNTDAMVIIAKLYKKHRNREKAELYASKALAITPQDSSVRELVNSIKEMK
jgi:tetratricopeptide (TPR) repeat protein